jgi:hypothetical protein
VSLGAQFSYYACQGSFLTPLRTPPNYIPKYLTLHNCSAVGSVVCKRHKNASRNYNLLFFNWVDGLNPNPEIYKENSKRLWLWFNVGYIYYLQGK